MLCFALMKTVSIRDLRQKWPEVEAALGAERVLIVTRDGKPVAKLVCFEQTAPKRKRFSPREHKRKIKKTWGETQVSRVRDFLVKERESE
jgi:antitoxin (DNA-binding transcriptional repressor) of toxin-antitoxin stability system